MNGKQVQIMFVEILAMLILVAGYVFHILTIGTFVSLLAIGSFIAGVAMNEAGRWVSLSDAALFVCAVILIIGVAVLLYAFMTEFIPFAIFVGCTAGFSFGMGGAAYLGSW